MSWFLLFFAIITAMTFSLVSSWLGMEMGEAYASSANNFCIDGVCLGSKSIEGPILSNVTSNMLDNRTVLSPTLSPNKSLLTFTPWGGKENRLNLNAAYNDSIPIFLMSGSSGSEPVGFVSQILNYSGKFISLSVGNVSKVTKDFQISFSFVLNGSQGNYDLIFVHGPLTIQGWRDNKFYEKIDSHSSKLIDLDQLFGSASSRENLLLKRIYVVMQKESSVDPMEFGISLQG